MSRVYYQLYLDDVLALTRTLVIKCGAVADTLNNELKLLGYPVDPDRPETWKYYMNLAGEYHVSDQRMTVRSMDTLEEIEFSKENLRRHRATARDYQPGSRYYRDLVRKFPNQAALINGILSPVDKTRAMNAQDGELLYYDPTHVEGNEANLMPNLQAWLYAFFSRWYNSQYILTDDLYLPAFLGVLYAQLPTVIQLLRLRNAKTPQAHSFHIREYLASNGRLDEYLPYLTKAQQLWLYRNIRFIKRNVGKQEIFDRLIANLLTPRGLPLTWYRLQHNVEQLPEQLYPDVEMVKYPINFGYNQSGLDRAEVHTILNRERDIARDNAAVQAAAEVEIRETFRSDRFSTLPTKVLESEVVDRTNSSVRSLEHVLLNEWLYLASKGRYRAYVNVTNPVTGEYMNLSVRDTFIVALYAFTKARGIVLDSIPRMIAYEVLRDPLPNHTELERLVDRRYVRDGLIQAIQDRITPLGEYITTERFYSACANLHQEYLKLWELYSFQEHYLSRGMLENVVRRHFKHQMCPLVDEVLSFEQWFKDNGYEVADLSPMDLDQLFADCVQAATGANLVTRVTLSEIQRAMLQLMGQLSSYSVQYLRNINHADFRFIGMPAIRLGDVAADSRSRFTVPSGRISVLHKHSHHAHGYRIGDDWLFPPTELTAATDTHLHIDPTVAVQVKPDSMAYIRLNTACVGLRRYQFAVDNPTPPDNDLGHYQAS
jgi:hypothetical protein